MRTLFFAIRASHSSLNIVKKAFWYPQCLHFQTRWSTKGNFTSLKPLRVTLFEILKSLIANLNIRESSNFLSFSRLHISYQKRSLYKSAWGKVNTWICRFCAKKSLLLVLQFNFSERCYLQTLCYFLDWNDVQTPVRQLWCCWIFFLNTSWQRVGTGGFHQMGRCRKTGEWCICWCFLMKMFQSTKRYTLKAKEQKIMWTFKK